MYKIVGWNLEPMVCEICGQLKDKTDMVVTSENPYDYFPACHDCTNGNVVSDKIAESFNKALKNLQFLECNECDNKWSANVNDPISGGCPKCGTLNFKQF
jgi:protein-arginine kinase activator protein McsA